MQLSQLRGFALFMYIVSTVRKSVPMLSLIRLLAYYPFLETVLRISYTSRGLDNVKQQLFLFYCDKFLLVFVTPDASFSGYDQRKILTSSAQILRTKNANEKHKLGPELP